MYGPAILALLLKIQQAELSPTLGLCTCSLQECSSSRSLQDFLLLHLDLSTCQLFREPFPDHYLK